jgi:tRNA A37 methylthiotransferase MiaB
MLKKFLIILLFIIFTQFIILSIGCAPVQKEEEAVEAIQKEEEVIQAETPEEVLKALEEREKQKKEQEGEKEK